MSREADGEESRRRGLEPRHAVGLAGASVLVMFGLATAVNPQRYGPVTSSLGVALALVGVLLGVRVFRRAGSDGASARGRGRPREATNSAGPHEGRTISEGVRSDP